MLSYFFSASGVERKAVLLANYMCLIGKDYRNGQNADPVSFLWAVR